MKLQCLEITNFKGINHFKIKPNGGNIAIFGMNASGKTSLADAVSWLLYDQDSTGASFLPKPLDLTGEAAHGIASIVEATFIFDDGADDLILKKSLCENWTKKHGSGKKVFEGHTTTYYIDDMEVSVRKKDYDERLSRIANSTILKLLSNTRFFAEGVQKTKRKDDPNRWDWEKRRELLFDLSDDMPTDEDIISSNPALSRMAEILDGKSAEKRKAVIKERQTGLNKLIHEIPVSIKERERDLPDITSLDLSAIEKELSELSEALALKNKEALRIESGGEIAEKVKRQRTIEAELLEIENKISAARNWVEAERRKKASEFETVQRKKLSDLETAREAEESARGKTERAINNREAANKAAEQEIIKLRVEWNTVNDEVFNELDTICPTCGQEYPEEKALLIRDNFNAKKAGTLLGINDNGKTVKAGIAERKTLNETDQADVSLYEKKIEELTEQINKIKSQAPEPEKEDKPVEKNKKQEALELDLAELKLNIEGLRSGNTMILGKVKAEIFALSEKQTAENLKKQTLESHAKDQARIKELGAQQKVCAKEFENLESDLFVLNEFTKIKAAMVEGKISEKFTITNFKLFNIQVNGEVDDCCKVVGDGIPWDAGLNKSTKHNIGVDVINTLSEHYDGLTLPLMIDNAESILKVIPSSSQIIKLVVSETVQCAKCDWTGLHGETNKILDDDNIITGETCPKCGGAIKEYKGLIVRES